MTNLPALVGLRDAKIRAHLAGARPGHFWYAHCPASAADLDAHGFDNYPTAPLPYPGLFFFELLLGATLHDDGGDTFTTWCAPVGDGMTTIDFAGVLWQGYEAAVRDYLARTPTATQLPVVFPGLCPLDIACNLYGTEAFCLLLAEDPATAAGVVDHVVTEALRAWARLEALGVRLVNGYGFPGLYCNDLQMPYVAPASLRVVLLPAYARLAQACGGLMLGVNTADVALMREITAIPGVLGGVFDRRLPLEDIATAAGHVLFILNHYQFDDTLDRPTCRDGAYLNPIICGFSRELAAVYRAVSDRCTMLITVERLTLAAVCAVRARVVGEIESIPGI